MVRLTRCSARSSVHPHERQQSDDHVSYQMLLLLLLLLLLLPAGECWLQVGEVFPQVVLDRGQDGVHDAAARQPLAGAADLQEQLPQRLQK